MRILLMTAAMLLCAGCNCLPDGEPPEKPEIVEIATVKNHSPLGATNLLSTSLTVGAINCLNSRTTVTLISEAEMPFRAYAAEVMASVQRTLGFKTGVSESDFILNAVFKPLGNGVFNWEMSLNRNGENIWSESVIMDTKKPN